jgi:glycine/D-amino acid oxidase-like deaminating enzyme
VIADVVIIGAGIVGACCARACAQAGLDTVLVDRGAVASGTTGAGEGNILVSDKEPGPELDLALLSRQLWAEMAGELGDSFELDPKGGLVVAARTETLDHLRAFARAQADSGVIAEEVAAADLRDHEPHISPELAGGVYYPQDMQVQPMLAAARIIEAGVATGRLRVITGCDVTAIDRDPSGAVSGVRTSGGDITTRAVVNAAGTWGGEVAALAGVDLPILPRRGFILVTEPLPVMVRHKVYAADYVANVASDNAGLETSAVIEGTMSWDSTRPSTGLSCVDSHARPSRSSPSSPRCSCCAPMAASVPTAPTISPSSALTRACPACYTHVVTREPVSASQLRPAS